MCVVWLSENQWIAARCIMIIYTTALYAPDIILETPNNKILLQRSRRVCAFTSRNFRSNLRSALLHIPFVSHNNNLLVHVNFSSNVHSHDSIYRYILIIINITRCLLISRRAAHLCVHFDVHINFVIYYIRCILRSAGWIHSLGSLDWVSIESRSLMAVIFLA